MAHLVEEMVEELDVDKHGCRVRELIRDHVQECLGTKHVVLRPRLAPLGLERSQTKLEDTDTVVVEHCVTRYTSSHELVQQML